MSQESHFYAYGNVSYGDMLLDFNSHMQYTEKEREREREKKQDYVREEEFFRGEFYSYNNHLRFNLDKERQICKRIWVLWVQKE